MAWPPDLVALKDELKIEPTEIKDDSRLTRMLNAVVAFVERVHSSRYNFAADPESDLPDPPADMELGALRLVARWRARGRSPDALIQMVDMGASRVPSFDADIERQLQIGRHAPWGFA